MDRKFPWIMRIGHCIFSTHPPIYPSAHSLFYAKRTQFQPASDKIHESKHANGTKFTPNIYLLLLKKNAKIAKNAHVLQISENNTLNSIYNKDLHKYFNPPNGARAMRDEQQKIENEPNLKLMCLKAPKRTQYDKKNGHK
jgi:hypothetical protein